MRIYCKLFLSLSIGAFVSFVGCQGDEVVDLVKYPVNQPTLTIDDTEGVSQAKLTAVYKSDGTLKLDGSVSRTYTFHLAASPEDATVSFDIMSTNIPKENIEINPTKVILLAGSTDASVTVALKNDDFSFAAPNYDAATYELGVRASVEGYKIETEPIESKVVVEKEAYTALCFVVGEHGNNASFERTYSQGGILNGDPISYTFKMKLDKPARKDVKVRLAITGLDEKFMSNITVTPAELVIPAGKLESAEITWSITDDFLKTTADPETHTLVVTASIESEDPVVVENKKENSLTFNVNKVFRNFSYAADKETGWIELDKAGWSVKADPNFQRDADRIIDGNGGKDGSDIYCYDDCWFIVDMKEEKTMAGLGIDYYNNSTASSPKKVTISTSMDNATWETQGAIDTPQSYSHYFQFFAPLKARYVKFNLSGLYNRYIDITEVYVYNGD